jgi:adenylate kinase family enzyme
VGSGGAGKSRFARRLAELLGLPIVHLDALYWNPGWVPTPAEEWRRTVEDLVGEDRWVIDGNYRSTFDLRLAACDTVVFLDVPRHVCLWRALKRRYRFHRQTRPDMRQGCPERLTPSFIRWIWNYPRTQRPHMLRRLSAADQSTKVVVLRSTSEIEAFLRSLTRRGENSDE